MTNAIEQLLRTHWPTYLAGLGLTLKLAVVAISIAIMIGLCAGSIWQTRFRVLSAMVTTYVEIFRNTPLILQVVYAYFALPELGIKLTGYQAGTLALALNGGAYLTAVVAAGIKAVSAGQRQAAQVLGLGTWDTYSKIILPQALRLVYPPVVNQFILMIHGTSIMSLITVQELTGAAGEVNSQTFLTLESYGIAAILYVLVINGVAFIAQGFGRRFLPQESLPTRPRLSAWRALGAKWRALGAKPADDGAAGRA